MVSTFPRSVTMLRYSKSATIKAFYTIYGLYVQMIGLVAPTNGTAYIHGIDLIKDMNEIYANIGVCPQHEYDHK